MDELSMKTHALQEEAIRRLRYLETVHCRDQIKEEERRKLIVEATLQLRKIIVARDIVRQVLEEDLYG